MKKRLHLSRATYRSAMGNPDLFILSESLTRHVTKPRSKSENPATKLRAKYPVLRKYSSDWALYEFMREVMSFGNGEMIDEILESEVGK